jgi:hypothetical protein
MTMAAKWPPLFFLQQTILELKIQKGGKGDKGAMRETAT